MKIFKTYRKLLPALISYNELEKHGLRALNSKQKILFRVNSVLSYFLLGIALITTSGFLAFEAKTIQEYASNVTIVAAITNDTFVFVSLRWRYKKVLKLIETCERMIEERKSILNIQSVEFLNILRDVKMSATY